MIPTFMVTGPKAGPSVLVVGWGHRRESTASLSSLPLGSTRRHPTLVRDACHARDGRTKLIVRSTLDEPAYLLVERGAWSSDAVLGTVVTSLPDFVDLFATEAPAVGLPLTIGRITLLFSDLTGSTSRSSPPTMAP
jgi:hypothetical protein